MSKILIDGEYYSKNTQLKNKNNIFLRIIKELNNFSNKLYWKFYCDLKYLLHVFSNLIDNAIKYSKDTIDITIKTSVIGNKLQITFQDKGIGMDATTSKHIFEKFYRAHSGNIHNVKGFGLGMSYVKWVMDIHKGSIKVDSVIDKGTTITLLLPI